MQAVRDGVCVIGRAAFDSGYGQITAMALEVLARSMNVAFRHADGRRPASRTLTVPSGRRVPVVDSSVRYPVYFYTDILWNGVRDGNWLHLPQDGVKIAHIAHDSDALLPEWVKILNERFDVAVFTAQANAEAAVASGVTIPVGTLPIALPIESLIARPYAAAGAAVTFGSVAAFHPRKGHETTVRAFLAEFASGENVRLVLHSNLAIGDSLVRLQRLAALDPAQRITVSSGSLPDDEKDELIDGFDVFVSSSKAEGYSIGPREALALGKPLVVSAIPAHLDFADVPGVFLVPTRGRTPAVYPEIDNRMSGYQAHIAIDDVRRSMREAYDFVRSDAAAATAHARKRRAAEFSATQLEPDYRRLIDPHAPVADRGGSSFTRLPEEVKEVTRRVAGRTGRAVGRRKLIVPAHDGGFFSVFNVFASHLTWSMVEGSPAMVIPDWDVTRLIQRTEEPLVSYCYSRPEDGNLWTKLFEPMYDLPEELYNDPEFMTTGSAPLPTGFNQRREPLLTYVHAYDLYLAEWFHRFRRQYGRAVRAHVRLRPEYASEIAAFRERKGDRRMIAVHVKHPSHAIEQPGGRIAGYDRYAEEVRRALRGLGVAESGDDWALFVATDQEPIVHRFQEDFGDRVLRFDDVARVTAAELETFSALGEAEQASEGWQLQHLRAADPRSWSPRLAWEVWRDAEAMAAGDVLIHAVSNVATAASYLGPDTRMVYCDPF